ncbi:MAG: DUF3997 domain-containing protein [Methylococcaceae bacterium]|nr:DUF3997 domain-containing protein [Methylococcaceae bacterium]
MTGQGKLRIFTLVFITIFITACDLFSPETHMGNGYYFVTLNTTNRYIFREINRINEDIVNPSIVASARIGDYSFSLRQPRIDFSKKSEYGEVSDAKFLNQCEFFIIDISNAVVYGPLGVNEFKKKTKDLNVCEHCLYEHTKSDLATYCVERADISPLMIK